MWQAITLGALLLLAPACRSGPPLRKVTAAPAGFHGFPNPAHTGGIWAETTYAPHLVRSHLLPVHLKVGLRGEVPGAPRLTAETLDPHLYLQDGTVLEWVPGERDGSGGGRPPRRVARQALRLTLLQDWEVAGEGFLLFRIPPGVRLHEPLALSSEGGRHHEVDLRNSLLSFVVLTDDGTRRLFVGLSDGRLPTD